MLFLWGTIMNDKYLTDADYYDKSEYVSVLNSQICQVLEALDEQDEELPSLTDTLINLISDLEIYKYHKLVDSDSLLDIISRNSKDVNVDILQEHCACFLLEILKLENSKTLSLPKSIVCHVNRNIRRHAGNIFPNLKERNFREYEKDIRESLRYPKSENTDKIFQFIQEYKEDRSYIIFNEDLIFWIYKTFNFQYFDYVIQGLLESVLPFYEELLDYLMTFYPETKMSKITKYINRIQKVINIDDNVKKNIFNNYVVDVSNGFSHNYMPVEVNLLKDIVQNSVDINKEYKIYSAEDFKLALKFFTELYPNNEKTIKDLIKIIHRSGLKKCQDYEFSKYQLSIEECLKKLTNFEDLNFEDLEMFTTFENVENLKTNVECLYKIAKNCKYEFKIFESLSDDTYKNLFLRLESESISTKKIVEHAPRTEDTLYFIVDKIKPDVTEFLSIISDFDSAMSDENLIDYAIMHLVSNNFLYEAINIEKVSPFIKCKNKWKTYKSFTGCNVVTQMVMSGGQIFTISNAYAYSSSKPDKILINMSDIKLLRSIFIYDSKSDRKFEHIFKEENTNAIIWTLGKLIYKIKEIPKCLDFAVSK